MHVASERARTYIVLSTFKLNCRYTQIHVFTHLQHHAERIWAASTHRRLDTFGIFACTNEAKKKKRKKNSSATFEQHTLCRTCTQCAYMCSSYVSSSFVVVLFRFCFCISYVFLTPPSLSPSLRVCTVLFSFFPSYIFALVGIALNVHLFKMVV